MNFELHLGDCLDLMKQLPDASIDLILCDLPYGTTRNKWDSAISLDALWGHYLRVIRGNGAIVLTAQTPFDKVLGASQIDLLRYEWIWEKEAGTGHLNSKFAPLKSHENVLVFSKGAACHVKDARIAMPYFPQMEAGKPYQTTKGSLTDNYDRKWDKIVTTTNSGERHPKTVLRFNRDKAKMHPTQKPVALMEYLIRTYTKEGDVVLDNCMGSGTTGVACMNTCRRFIGMEMDAGYFAAAQARILAAVPPAANDNAAPFSLAAAG
jgi:site-specific DNA-methyltransferase (adenine-specific)